MNGEERKRQKRGRCEVTLRDIVSCHKELCKPLTKVLGVICIVLKNKNKNKMEDLE